MRIPAEQSILFEFPKHERVSSLINEAVKRIPHLDKQYNQDLDREFIRVQTILEAAPVAHSQKTMLLGLARQHIDRAEKVTVRQMIDNASIGVDEMSHLVRVRLICAELSNLIAEGLVEFRALKGRRLH